MARYFLGDNLELKGKPDRIKIHWGEPWERDLVKAKRYKGKDSLDKRARTIVLVYTNYGTFAVRKSYFEKYKKMILATARGYRVIEIRKDGIRKEPIKTIPLLQAISKPKRAKELGLLDLDSLSLNVKDLIDSSLSFSENLKNIGKYLLGTTQKDITGLSYEFDRKAEEEYIKYLQDPDKWLENIKYQEKKLKELLKNV